MPFRTAHSIAGSFVSLAEKKQCSLAELSIGELMQVTPLIGADFFDTFQFEMSVEQYSSSGGTAKSSVEKQIAHFNAKHGDIISK